MNCRKTISNREREKGDNITPIKLSEGAINSHTACDDQLDCISVNNVPQEAIQVLPREKCNLDQIRANNL